MTEAGAILQSILRQGWAALAAFLVVMALLGGLAQVFKFTGGVLLGSGIWVSEAVAGVLGVIVIALFGFMAVPVLAQSALVAADVVEALLPRHSVSVQRSSEVEQHCGTHERQTLRGTARLRRPSCVGWRLPRVGARSAGSGAGSPAAR